ncbi:MAG: integrase core domain-containing protein [Candidatus Micrarchaeaceae archaeon]
MLSRTCNRRDAVRTLEQAYLSTFNGEKVKDLVLRTDNGTQFTARIFKETEKLLGITQEFIEKHTPEDNGDNKSFHGSIKIDYIWPYEFEDYNETNNAIHKAFIDCDKTRPHSSIDYLVPIEFNMRWIKDNEFRKKYEEKINMKVNISVS